MKCPCKNCLIVGRCRRLPPDTVVKKCDLVCEYLKMEGSLRTVSYITSSLADEELGRRFKRIIECLGLEGNGGCYIGSNPSPRTLKNGFEFVNSK